MDKHCKGCVLHHNARHPKDNSLVKFNDWCCALGKFAPKAVGQCKIYSMKKIKPDSPHDISRESLYWVV